MIHYFLIWFINKKLLEDRKNILTNANAVLSQLKDKSFTESYKVNYTNLDMEINNPDTTVNFIYGPLIIGLSVGMIGLFTIMG